MGKYIDLDIWIFYTYTFCQPDNLKRNRDGNAAYLDFAMLLIKCFLDHHDSLMKL